MASSKTARASMRASAAKGGGGVRAAGTPRFVSLAAGQRAYVYTDQGKTLSLKVGTPEFVAAVKDLLGGRDAERVAEEIAELDARFPDAGWAASLEQARIADEEELAEAA